MNNSKDIVVKLRLLVNDPCRQIRIVKLGRF